MVPVVWWDMLQLVAGRQSGICEFRSPERQSDRDSLADVPPALLHPYPVWISTSERQEHNSVAPLFRLRSPPDKKQRFDDFTDRDALADDEHTWMVRAGRQPVSKVSRHGAPVVRDEDAVLVRRESDKVPVVFPRRPAVFTSRISAAGSRDRKPSTMSASRSSSARSGRSRSLRTDLPASRFQPGKELRVGLAQSRLGWVELTLALPNILADHCFVFQIVGDGAVDLREFQCRERRLISGDAPCWKRMTTESRDTRVPAMYNLPSRASI